MPAAADWRVRAAGAGKALLGPRATTTLRTILRGYGRPRWGNLRRTTPFSSTFGFERGTPIDRYYLHQFLDAQRALITGDVLEIQTDAYTKRFGRDLRVAETFDVVPNCSPTYVCDPARCEET